MSDMIPDEVMEEILSRGTVNSLIRFRCVSKSWRAIIDSPSFIKKQLNHSLKTNSDHGLIRKSSIRHGSSILADEPSLHFADFDSLHNTDLAVFEELSHPLKRDHKLIQMLGSCNGLICLLYHENIIVLWNPSTRKCKVLPVVKSGVQFHRTGFRERHVYGFGFDSVNDDYKIVRIVINGAQEKVNYEVKVYSSKLDSWTRIQDFPYYFLDDLLFQVNGMFVTGALHWIVTTTRSHLSNTARSIGAFDLGTGEYRLVPKPECFGCMFHMNMGVLGGCLCVMYCCLQEHIDIWVMKQYGIKESWSNMISVKQGHTIGLRYAFVRPLAYSKCGRLLLLQQDNQLIWYDLEKSTYAEIKIPRANIYEFVMFCPSLVELNDGSCRKIGNETEPEERRNQQLVYIQCCKSPTNL